MAKRTVPFIGALALLTMLACGIAELTSAKTYLQENNLEKAEEFFLLAMELEAEQDNAEVPYLLATEVYAQQERWAAMDSMLTEAVLRNPEQRIGQYTVEELALNTRKFHWSRQYNAAAALFNAGFDDREGGKLTLSGRDSILAAKETFRSAVLILPAETAGQTSLVNCFIQLEDYDGAREAIAAALNRDPQNGLVLALAGDLAWREIKQEEALDYYNRAHQIMPENIPVMQRLTSALLDMGKPRKALQVLEASVKQAPKDPDTYFNIGVVYSTIANSTLVSSREQYLEAIGADEIHYDQLATAKNGFEQSKEAFSEARYNLENALELAPDDEVSAQAISEILSLQKQLNMLMRSAEEILKRKNE